MTKAEVQELAMQLSEKDRLELGRYLVDSTSSPLTDDDKLVIDEALDLYDRDPEAVLSEDQFRSEIAARRNKSA